MTEAEWMVCEYEVPMMQFIGAAASARKWRLFAVACCRRIEHAFSREPKVEFRLNLAERYADGLATAQELREGQAFYLGGPSFQDFGHQACIEGHAWAAMSAQATCLHAILYGWTKPQQPSPSGFIRRLRRFFTGTPSPTPPREEPPEYHAERVAQCNLIRDIFGNPFRPVTFDPAWRTSDALLLATGIYDDRAFDRMPILADALQDAGCTSDDILNHLRDPHATHVRGCWALDLVLGKE